MKKRQEAEIYPMVILMQIAIPFIGQISKNAVNCGNKAVSDTGARLGKIKKETENKVCIFEIPSPSTAAHLRFQFRKFLSEAPISLTFHPEKSRKRAYAGMAHCAWANSDKNANPASIQILQAIARFAGKKALEDIWIWIMPLKQRLQEHCCHTLF
jgi:hypothetical protein